MPIKLNGATNGSVELNVPAAVGSDLQLTLPATAGEVIVKATDGSVDLGSVDIDSSGNVGIGNTAMSALADNDANDLVVGPGNANAGITVYTGTGNYGSLTFADGTSGDQDYRGSVVYHHNGDSMRFNTAATERMRIDSSGNVLIGTSSYNSTVKGVQFNQSGQAFIIAQDNPALQVNRLGGDGTVVSIRNDSSQVGTITVSGSATAYNTSSDYRLKENVVNIADGITRFKQLSPKRFNFIADDTRTVDGFLAHEAQTVVPEAVTGTHNEVDADGNAVMQGIDQSKLVPLLTAALQEAIAKIETLETKVASLEASS